MSEEYGHGDIMRALGKIEGELTGIQGKLDQHGKDIRATSAVVTTLQIESAARAVHEGGKAGSKRGAYTGAGTGALVALLVDLLSRFAERLGWGG